MNEYEIRVFPEASSDLDEIADSLSILSQQEALDRYDLIIKEIGTLSSTPERFPLAKDTQLRLRGYRTLQAENYVVFYKVNGKTVEICRILFARRRRGAV